MRGVLDTAARGISGRFGDHLTYRSLQFIGIGLRLYAVEIEVHGGFFDTIKVLQIGEGYEPAVAETMSLIWRNCCAGALRTANDRSTPHAKANKR